jgi:hypothetical protein
MFLVIAAFLLLCVIIAQNALYAPLRQETISDGLYGPYHWWLDGSYTLMTIALVSAFAGKGLPTTLAWTAGGALLVTAISNTFSGWADKITHGKHALVHTWFSILMFLSMIGLQVSVDYGWFWWLSGAGLAIPAFIYGLFTVWKKPGILAGPAAEKTAVLFLCLWMMIYSATR